MVQFLFLCLLFFSVTWGVPSIVTFGYMGGAHYFFVLTVSVPIQCHIHFVLFFFIIY